MKERVFSKNNLNEQPKSIHNYQKISSKYGR